MSYSSAPIVDDKIILIEGLDLVETDFRPILVFLVLYIFNATLALPVFILKMCLTFLTSLLHNLQMRKFRQVIMTFIYYSIDIFMAISVLMMYIFTIFKVQYSLNYQDWATSCLIFLQSQILMSTYMQSLAIDKTDLTFNFLISDTNMQKLGLGRLALLSIQKPVIDIKNDLQMEFFSFIRDSMKNENIDSTLYYFALESDGGILTIENLERLDQTRLNHYLELAFDRIKQGFGLHQERNEFESTEKKEKVLQQLRSQGFRGYRHAIDNFFYPHYEYTKFMQHANPTDLILIVAGIILIKGLYPFYIISTKSDNPRLEYSLVICFMFMYLNMVTILIGLVVNDDLKGKRYILNVLQTMIVPNKPVDQDVDDNESAEAELPMDLPYNTKYKLDLSCNLSLESWDNIRRLTLLIDMEKQDFNEATFFFLALYFVYTYLNLSSVFLDFDLIPILHKFFQDPILEWNMVIDFALIALLFLNRVYQGTLFNNTFQVIIFLIQNILESIKKIEIVYEDKKALFDFYFGNNMMGNIQNPTYKRITQNIYCAAGDRVLFGLASAGVKQISVPEFLILAKQQSKQKVNQLCATMTKVKDQIEFDSDHFSHKMLGLFRSNIWSLLSTFGFLLYMFFHSKIKVYMNRHKVKQL